MNNDSHILAGLEWLKLAQDKTDDGGVSAWYSLINGWQPSYIETTGYIISTFLECAQLYQDQDLEDRAIKMADFLIDMQLPSGAYRAHTPEVNKNDHPVIFDLGQDLIGMTDIYQYTKEEKYRQSAIQAADFLISIQEKDGSWLQHTFGGRSYSYHSRVAWGVAKVYEISGENRFKKSAIANLDWGLKNQLENGWIEKNEFPPPHLPEPFTHSISYAIEGFLFAGLVLKRTNYITAAIKASLPLIDYYKNHNYMPGTFNSEWKSQDSYSCLTGDAQLCVVWLTLYSLTQKAYFLTSAQSLLGYLKKKQTRSSISHVNGALAGSDPIWGSFFPPRGYCRLAYPNWATKFYIDALLLEHKLTT